MELYFWQNALGIHQSAHIRSLAAKGHKVTMIAETDILPDRQAMGWGRSNYGFAKVVVHPSDAEVEALIQDSSTDAVHIASGYRGYRIGHLALCKCMERSSRVGLMCEAGDPRGLKGIARRFLYAAERRTWLRSVDFVLGMGDMGVDWYRRAGYARVFPYGYFVEKPEFGRGDEFISSDRVQLIYIGQCIPLKGIDLLLRALRLLDGSNWELTVIGGGTSKNGLIQLATDLDLAKQVRFLPSMPNQLAMKHLMASDLLVLPSHKDGWGAVINEALMCGVPAVCSSACGAKDLLSESWRGDVFSSGSVHHLTHLLAKWIARGKCTVDQRARLRAWSSRTIEGSIAADYLLGVLAHVYDHAPLPVAPWATHNGKDEHI